MKGRFFLGMTALVLSLTLAGCGGNSEANAVNNLSSQLDKTNNSIATVREYSETDLDLNEETLNKLATDENCERIQRNVQVAKNALMTENYYRNSVMNETAKIKQYLSRGDIKLAKNQVSALKDLSANLSKYNNNVARSSSEFNSTFRNYTNSKRTANKNPERVNARLNKIACNSNARCAYYENLLNTLNQVEEVLGIYNNQDIPNNNQIIENENSENQTELENSEIENNATQNNETNEENNGGLVKNIDTYRPSQDVNNTNNINNVNNLPANNNFNNNPNNFVNNYPNNLAGRTNNNMMYYPDNMIGRRHVLNPNRNTDTYGPTIRNIDTYRGDGYYYNNGYNYGYNSNNFNRMTMPVGHLEMNKNENNIDENKPTENVEKIDNIINNKQENLNENLIDIDNVNESENEETIKLNELKQEEKLEENMESLKDIAEKRIEEFEDKSEDMKIKEIDIETMAKSENDDLNKKTSAY